MTEYKRHHSTGQELATVMHSRATASATHLPHMNSGKTYDALLKFIVAEEPSRQDGVIWDQITLSITVAPLDQRQIDLLVEAAASRPMGQLMDTLGRAFLQDSNNIPELVAGSFQGFAAAVAALLRRMLDLRALRGAEFCEAVRRMVEEKWMAREAVPPVEILCARRETERRVLAERFERMNEEKSLEFVNA